MESAMSRGPKMGVRMPLAKSGSSTSTPRWGLKFWTSVLVKKHILELASLSCRCLSESHHWDLTKPSWASHHTRLDSQGKTGFCLAKLGLPLSSQSTYQVFYWICLHVSNPLSPQINFWFFLQSQIFIGWHHNAHVSVGPSIIPSSFKEKGVSLRELVPIKYTCTWGC